MNGFSDRGSTPLSSIIKKPKKCSNFRGFGNLENVKQVVLDRKRPYWNNKIVVKLWSEKSNKFIKIT